MVIMPASGGRVAFGIDQVDADGARSKLIQWVHASKPEYLHDSFDEPFMFILSDRIYLLWVHAS